MIFEYSEPVVIDPNLVVLRRLLHRVYLRLTRIKTCGRYHRAKQCTDNKRTHMVAYHLFSFDLVSDMVAQLPPIRRQLAKNRDFTNYSQYPSN